MVRSARVAEALSDTTQRSRERVVDLLAPFRPRFRPLSSEQRHLEQREWIDIRIPERNRRLQNGSVIEQLAMSAHEQQRFYSTLELAGQRVEELHVATQLLDVHACDLEVGLRAYHFHFAEKIAEE